MTVRVRWAFLIFGRRKAGTPLAMASTPVSAEHPLAKARSSSRTIAAWPMLLRLDAYCALSATGGRRAAVRTSPTPTITTTLAMKR